MLIYRVTNIINGKSYIGMTIRPLKERIREHYKGATHKNAKKSRLQYAILKYGRENFKWEILHTATSLIELIDKEKEYIRLYNTTDCGIGYNVASGGFRNNNFLGLSSEAKERIRNKLSISAARQYANLTKEEKEACSKRMSDTCRKYWDGISAEEYARRREECRLRALGRKVSDATRKKMSDSRKGMILSDETITKMAMDRNSVPPGYAYQPKRINTAIRQPKKSMSKTGSLNPIYGKYGKDNVQSIPILCTNLKTKEACVIVGIQEAGRVLGIPATKICRCLRHPEHHSAYGYSFSYMDSPEGGEYNDTSRKTNKQEPS